MNSFITKSALAISLLAGSLAMAGGTLSPAEYLKKLSAASTKASPEVSQDFLMDDPRNPEKIPSIVEQIGSIAGYADESSLSLTKALKHPQYYNIGGYGKGGLAVWKNDAFPVDFFVRHFERWKKGESPQTSALLNSVAQQPWFKSEGGNLVLQTTGASARMLSLLKAQLGGQSVKLYRGTTVYEADVFKFHKLLSSGQQLPLNWRETLSADQKAIVAHNAQDVETYTKLVAEKYAEESDLLAKQSAHGRAVAQMEELIAKMEQAKDDKAIDQFLRDAVADLMGKGLFKGLFTTPSQNRAQEFSKGEVVEFEVSYATLEEALAGEQLFVGMEKFILEGGVADVQVEIAFTTDGTGEKLDKLVDTILKSYRGSKPVATGNTFH